MNKCWLYLFTLVISVIILPLNFNYSIESSDFNSSSYINRLENNKISTSVIETITQVSSNKIEVEEGEELNFIFSVYESESLARITEGTVTILDTTTGRNSTYPVYSGEGLYENISWLITSSDNPSGWHTFSVAYNGILINDIEYNESCSEVNILILDSWIWINGSQINMYLAMNSTTVTLGQKSNIEITLTAIKNSYFRIKSYIIVYDKTTGLILGQRIFSDDLSDYIIGWEDIFMVNISIPYFQALGSQNLRVYYSGSSYVSDHRHVYEDLAISVKGGSYNVDISLSNDIIERSNNFENYLLSVTVRTFGIEVQLGNLELILRHPQITGINQTIFNNTALADLTREIKFNQSNILGNYSFYSKFTIFGDEFSTENSFLLIDDTFIDLYVNSTSVNPGNTILIYGWVTEEDVKTKSVLGTVTLYYSNDTLLSTGLISTDSNGYFEYYWTISSDSGAKQISLYAFFIPDEAITRFSESEEITFTITRSVTIMIFIPDGDIFTRGDLVNFEINIFTGEIPITQGEISLSLINGTNIITTEIIGLTTTLNWDIPLNQAIGITTFNISYSGTLLYHPAYCLQNVRIFSTPYLTEIYMNSSDLIRETTLLVSGSLLDENDFPVIEKWVSFWEDEQYLGAAITNTEGIYVFMFEIPLDYPYGYHFWRVTFSGDGQYYNEIFLYIILDFRVNPTLSITQYPDTGQANAGEDIFLNITGRVHSQALIQWKLRDWDLWYDILIINFSNEGEATILWQIPNDVKGLLDIRVVDQDTQEWAFTSLEIFVIPQIIITIDNQQTDFFVNDILSFTVNCTEKFDVFINNVRIAADLIGIKDFDIALRDRGQFNLTVESYSEFSRMLSKVVILDIFESINLSVNYPSEFNENSSITLNTFVTNSEYHNIEGLTVYVQDNITKTIIATAVTNIYGEANPTFSLAVGNYTLNIYTMIENYYTSSFHEIIIIVKTQSILELKPLIGFTEELITIQASLCSFSGNPIADASILFEIQSNDNIWMRIGSVSTLETGKATLNWTVLLEPGEYNIKASFNGSLFISNTISSSILYINAGNGPKLVFSNYTFSEVSDDVLQVQFIAKFESLTTVTNVNALLSDSNESLLMTKIEYEVNSFRLIFQLQGFGNYSCYLVAKNSLNVSSFWFQKLVLEKEDIIPQVNRNTDFSSFINLVGYIGVLGVAAILLTLSFRIKNTGGI